MSINKENLQKQIEEMKVKLADMEAELNKPDVVINYWQPTNMDKFYWVNTSGCVQPTIYCFDRTHEKEAERDKVGYRVFKTEGEAQKYAEYVKAEGTLRRAIAINNKGWLPDWNNGRTPNYIVVLNDMKLEVFSYNSIKYLPNFMYIKSAELAEKLKKEYEKEFITYLSY